GGAAFDQRADLFSLGSVLYVMCSGRPPFRAATVLAVLKRVAEDTPRPIREIIPEVPEWLCAIIARLHAKRPADRFQAAGEVADLLERCLAELQLRGRVTSAGPGAPAVAAPNPQLKLAPPAVQRRRSPLAALRRHGAAGALACALAALVLAAGV